MLSYFLERPKKQSLWMQGLLHAEEVVQDSSLKDLEWLIATNEYSDSDPYFFMGVIAYLRYYRESLLITFLPAGTRHD